MKTLIQRTAALQRRLGTSFDLVYRSIQIQSVQAEMIFLSSLTDARLLAAITESFVVSAKDGLQVTLYPGAVEQVWDEEAAITSLLSGQCMVLLENDASWYCVEVRSYPLSSQQLSPASNAASAVRTMASWRTSSSMSA